MSIHDFSESELKTIDRFLRVAAEWPETGAAGYRKIPASKRPDFVVQQLKYFSHCTSCIEWILRIVQQRLGAINDAKDNSIRQPGGNRSGGRPGTTGGGGVDGEDSGSYPPDGNGNVPVAGAE